MLHKTLRAAALGMAIAGGFGAVAQPASASTVLDFADLAGPAGGGIAGYTSQGYRVSPSMPSGGFLRLSKNHPYSGDPDGATLIHTTQNMHSIFERTDGGVFDFISIDLTNYYNNANPFDLLFTFTDASGVVTTQTYRTDNIRGLETATFNQKNLTRFTMNSGLEWVQFDNVVLDTVSAVPEPATWAMMLVGFFTVGGALRTSRRATRATLA